MLFPLFRPQKALKSIEIENMKKGDGVYSLFIKLSISLTINKASEKIEHIKINVMFLKCE